MRSRYGAPRQPEVTEEEAHTPLVFFAPVPPPAALFAAPDVWPVIRANAPDGPRSERAEYLMNRLAWDRGGAYVFSLVLEKVLPCDTVAEAVHHPVLIEVLERGEAYLWTTRVEMWGVPPLWHPVLTLF